MSEPKKARYDLNSPESRALIDEIVHGTFMKEGTMAAFPTCFPGASVPIPADESKITCLDITSDGIVYGGTSGRAAHVFVGMFHGATGVVFDRGVVAGATHCVAVCCGKNQFAAFLNGPRGGQIAAGPLSGLPFDLIQEWGFGRPPYQALGTVDNEPLVHAVAAESKTLMAGITTNHLFTVDPDRGTIAVVAELPGQGRLAAGFKNCIWGQDGAGHLWRYDAASKILQRRAVPQPPGDWSQVPVTWARDPHRRLLYTANASGDLFSFDEERGFSPALGRTLLAPAGPMAVTHDGRLFGFCGADLAKMFCYDPATRQTANLGVALSVLERRRYGYVFGDAVTGRDGQIYFGENDDLGHLWLYFPKILPSRVV